MEQQTPMVSGALSTAAMRVTVAWPSAISTSKDALTAIEKVDSAITRIKENFASQTIDDRDWSVVKDAAIAAVKAVDEAWNKTWAVDQAVHAVEQIAASLTKRARASRVVGFKVEDVAAQVKSEVGVLPKVLDLTKDMVAAWAEVAEATESMTQVIHEAMHKWAMIATVNAMMTEATKNMTMAIDEVMHKWTMITKVNEAMAAAKGNILVEVKMEIASVLEKASQCASTAKDKVMSADTKTLAVFKDEILNVDDVMQRLVPK
jgi:hypothetical protein